LGLFVRQCLQAFEDSLERSQTEIDAVHEAQRSQEFVEIESFAAQSQLVEGFSARQPTPRRTKAIART